jgi:hypothetical protein
MLIIGRERKLEVCRYFRALREYTLMVTSKNCLNSSREERQVYEACCHQFRVRLAPESHHGRASRVSDSWRAQLINLHVLYLLPTILFSASPLHRSGFSCKCSLLEFLLTI